MPLFCATPMSHDGSISVMPRPAGYTRFTGTHGRTWAKFALAIYHSYHQLKLVERGWGFSNSMAFSSKSASAPAKLGLRPRRVECVAALWRRRMLHWKILKGYGSQNSVPMIYRHCRCACTPMIAHTLDKKWSFIGSVGNWIPYMHNQTSPRS